MGLMPAIAPTITAMLLFSQMELQAYLAGLLNGATSYVEEADEDETLGRSVDDLVAGASDIARCETLQLHTAQATAGDVQDFLTGPPGGHQQWNVHIWAEYSFTGNPGLLSCMPSARPLQERHGEIRGDQLRIDHYIQGKSTANISAEDAKVPLDRLIGQIANTLDVANNDAQAHNRTLDEKIRPVVEAKRERILARRNLMGQLGFPLARWEETPRPVPLERKRLGIERRTIAKPEKSRSYQDEWELLRDDYEEVLSVIAGMLLAIERTPLSRRTGQRARRIPEETFFL